MRWKTTLVLLLATLGLGTYVSRVELRQPTREARERQPLQVFNISPEAVNRIAFASPNAGPVTLRRAGSGWVLDPEGYRADPDLAERLLREASHMTASRILSASGDAPLDPSVYGLQPSTATLTLTTDRESAEARFGETTAVGPTRYLMVSGRDTIFVVPAALFDQLNQPRDHFRDPVLMRLEFVPEQLSLRAPSTALTISHRGIDWVMTQPVADAVDAMELNRAFRRVETLQIQRVVDDAPAVEQRAAWGLDPPVLELSFLPPGNLPPLGLFFGALLPDAPHLRYAKRSDDPSLYAVNAAEADRLLLTPERLRAKTCFQGYAHQATRVDVRRGQAGWSVERADGPDGEWRAVEAGAAVDQPLVEQFLDRLLELQIAGFVDDAPAEPARNGWEHPEGAIVLTVQDQPPQRLLIGPPLPDGKGRYGRLEKREVVVRLPAEIEALWSTTLEQLRPGAPGAALSVTAPE